MRRQREHAPYYGPDLARVHHLGFGFHADACAPGILSLLEPVRERGGLVVELGCGSGLLTRRLVDAGHRVIATDASPSMLELAREHAPGTEDTRLLVLPDDPIPAADAIVSVGHVLNYLPDRDSIERALVSAAKSLSPGGLLAVDLCDLEWGEMRRDAPNASWVEESWALITEFSVPDRQHFVRDMTIFLPNDDGSWRRSHERHDNVLVDTGSVPELLGRQGIEALVGDSFGTEKLPVGLRAVVGRRPPV